MTVQEHLLSILAEECAEVAQRASKALRFGLAESQPGQPLSNAERIRLEFADLCAVYEMIGFNPPTRSEIEAKKLKVRKFLEYSEKCGCVDAKPTTNVTTAELEELLNKLMASANQDGGFSEYYEVWQTVLHGLGKIIAMKMR